MLKNLVKITKTTFILCLAVVFCTGFINAFVLSGSGSDYFIIGNFPEKTIDTPTPSPSGTPTPTPTDNHTPTPTPTDTPTPTPTDTPTPTPTDTPTPTPTETPDPVESPPPATDDPGDEDPTDESPGDEPGDDITLGSWWENFELSTATIIAIAVGAGGVICIVVAIILFVAASRKKKSLLSAHHMQAPANLTGAPNIGSTAAAEAIPTAAFTGPALSMKPPPVLIGNSHHIGARDSQQDSFCISDIFNEEIVKNKGILGVVADGMGGLADGAEISAIVTKTMLTYFNDTPASGTPELDLLSMVYAANDNVVEFVSNRSESGGSTVVAVNIIDDKLYWIAVGDSHIYLVRNGALMQINRDHTYAEELDEKAATGEITWEEAVNHPKRGALTSYLGMRKPDQIDRNLRPTQLLNGDRILLMSDGIFGTINDEEILETMVLVPQESATLLMEKTLARQNPHQDNMTVIVFEYKSYEN